MTRGGGGAVGYPTRDPSRGAPVLRAQLPAGAPSQASVGGRQSGPRGGLLPGGREPCLVIEAGELRPAKAG